MRTKPAPATPRSIVLIHGLWLTPRSWEHFRSFYEAHGYKIFTPAWPGEASDVDAKRQSSPTQAGIGIAEIVAHYDLFVRSLHEPAIFMGHGFGGLIVQMLLDHGLGSVGMAIASVPPKGVPRFPCSPFAPTLPYFSTR